VFRSSRGGTAFSACALSTEDESAPPAAPDLDQVAGAPGSIEQTALGWFSPALSRPELGPRKKANQ
jgi:hypothetical protein